MLYPPIVDYMMPAFDYRKQVRIYFAISTYNSMADVAQAQILCRFQRTNGNALNTSIYPNKIKCCDIHQVLPEEDPARAATAARYYITLNPGDLAAGAFSTSTIYKVQIRLSSRSWSPTAAAATLSSVASEWSTVTLLKPIAIPRFNVSEMGGDELLEDQVDQTVSIIYSGIEPVFTCVYEQNGAETLKNWRLRLYDSIGKIVLADSGVTAANPYEANGQNLSWEVVLPYTMTTNTSYRLVYDIQTKNGYTDSREYLFSAVAFAAGVIDAKVNASVNVDDGYAKVDVVGNGQIVHTNITIRRTSSKSNFTIWEDIGNKTFENSSLDWTYYDFTIESGVFYQYAVQTRDNRGRRSSSVRSEIVMGEFEDSFLTERGQTLQDALQLKIRYNMSINSFAINVGEAKTDTIGSKYPFVRRNGNMYYRSFPFSFLISVYEDDNHLFATESELKSGQTELYQVRRNALQRPFSVNTGRYDYTYERFFREKVEEFLYDNKVKLFRSATEGNILVKLMDITLTPNADLSRMIYSVDATAIEIDDASLINIDKYGIQSIGTYNPNITFNEVRIGQMNRIRKEWIEKGLDKGDNPIYELETIEDPYPAGFNIMGDTGDESSIETIKSKFHWGSTLNGVVVSDLYLSYLRIQIDSDPYLIKNVRGTLMPLDDIAPGTEGVDNETLLGTLVDVCGTTILIEYPNRIYEMKGQNVHIGSSEIIAPIKETAMTVDFVANLSAAQETSTVASTLIYHSVNSQLVDVFASQANIYTQIYQKYWLDLYESKAVDKPYYTQMQTLYNIDVEADPGVVFYAAANGNDKVQRFVIDETGDLMLDPGEGTGYITAFYFYGRNIQKRWLKGAAAAIPSEKPATPVDMSCYQDSDGVHIYYNGAWYLGEERDNGNSYDIECSIPAIVNYYAEIVKGIY